MGMLSCKMDVPIGLDIGLTLFTGALAVGFTFLSLGKDVLRNSYVQGSQWEASNIKPATALAKDEDAVQPLLAGNLNGDRLSLEQSTFCSDSAGTLQRRTTAGRSVSDLDLANHLIPAPIMDGTAVRKAMQASGSAPSGSGSGEGDDSNSHQHWSFGSSRVDDLMSMATQRSRPHRNPFIETFKGLLAGFCLETVLMGLLWSLSLTCMHYGGLIAMHIPEGHMTLSPVPVVISAMISWVVCIAGYIYMTNVEPFLSQQVLFSVVAAVGIASMHFTGTSSESK